MDDRSIRIVVALLAVIALILAALLVFLLVDGDGGDAADTTTTTVGDTTTTSTAAETTTSAPAATTSSSSAVDTTTTSSSTTSSTTTTTLPELVLGADGVGGAGFGATPGEAIGFVTTVLGPPTEDSGWIEAFSSPYGVCPAPEVRGVHWGPFVLLFTRAATDFAGAGTDHLFSYYYTDNAPPAAGLGTAENIFVGSTRAELDAAYGARLEVFDDVFGVMWHVDRDPGSQIALSGFLSGPLATDHVETINGGIGCGE